MKRIHAFIFVTMAISLLLHLGLITGVIVWAPLFSPPKPEAIEITLDTPPPAAPSKQSKNNQQIVRKSLVPDQMKAPDDETLARFLSEQRQRVKKEMQASDNGMTENRTNTSTLPKKSVTPPKQAQKAQEKTQVDKNDTDKDGYRTVDITKELAEMNALNQGQSTVGESLPTDVKIGSFTALNTDRYLFYSFYARIEELVRYRWETRVMTTINGMDPALAMNLSRRNWNTQVEFLLDKRGFLQKAMVMKESGVKGFDAAAVNAFKEARVFPNPPQEMIEEDGYIHLRYTFTVNYAPPTLVNSR
ncbi:energy transducer TonB [Bdellovibrio sp. ZAP7]|uniref:energy transducer TonB family protein n=1 Tax=Bdellovibrio sp. ZAP7 TaxID=2231053 RepID=UPI001FEEBAE6|nr:energy transducer TonB [Bdellovibrio sp. ZAP7]